MIRLPPRVAIQIDHQPPGGIDSVDGISQVSSMTTIKEARELLGVEAANMTDEQVQQMMDGFDVIAEMIIDLYLSMSPAERAKYKTKISQTSASPVVQDISLPPSNYQI